MPAEDGVDLRNDPFGSNFFPLLRTLAADGFLVQTAMGSETVDSMLRSRALKDPSKFLEQANAILSSNSEIQMIEDASQLPPEDDNNALTTNGMDDLQKRRPALGRRRAKFSFKPSQSQPVPPLNPSLSIDNLQDPDEFFAAYERLENAEKELKKSRGDTLVDPFQHPEDRKARPRRQGILGKMVSYKHIYPTTAGNEENPVSSQEEMSKISPSNMTLDVASSDCSQSKPTIQPGGSQEAEKAYGEVLAVTGGKDEAENRINILLDELLSNCQDLEGGDMISFLQERLHVKPVTLDKLSFPDLESVQRTDIKASKEPLSRSRKALSDLQQGIRSKAEKTPKKNQQKVESFRCLQSSPTPPRSPFASMSMLTKRILQIDPPRDPFSMPVDADLPSDERFCSIQGLGDKQALSAPLDTDQLEKRSFSTSDDPTLRNDGKSFSLDDNLQSQLDDEGNIVGNDFDSEKAPKADIGVPLDMPMDDNSSKFDNLSNDGDATSQAKVKDMSSGALVSQDLEISLKDLIIGTAQCSGDQPGPEKSCPAGTCFPLDEQSKDPTTLSEQHDEDPQAHSTTSVSKRRKENATSKKRPKKSRLCRQSLAGAGTKFESGVRRSTRITSKPLEYWRGERFLYGRIHESLPTVIGIKNASPGKGEIGVLKVKSYVSEEYAQLVQLAGLH